jgi:phospholipase C
LLLAVAALGLTAPASAQINAFQHIIVVKQQNRWLDNMFEGLRPPANPSACSINPGSGQYNIQITAWLDKTSQDDQSEGRKFAFSI